MVATSTSKLWGIGRYAMALMLAAFNIDKMKQKQKLTRCEAVIFGTAGISN